MHYSSGMIFIGAWKQDKREGEGSEIFKDGGKFSGVFQND